MTHTIASGTSDRLLDLPSGFDNRYCVLIGARIVSKYGSSIDAMYNGTYVGEYFGNVAFNTEQRNKFKYAPFVSESAREITFVFYYFGS